jgi:hypothetical protein
MTRVYWCSTERAGTLAATDLHADLLVAAIAHAPSLTPQLVIVIVEVVERNPYPLSWLHRSSMSKIRTWPPVARGRIQVLLIEHAYSPTVHAMSSQRASSTRASGPALTRPDI